MQKSSSLEPNCRKQSDRNGVALPSTTVPGSVSSTIEANSNPSSFSEEDYAAAMILMSLKSAGSASSTIEANSNPSSLPEEEYAAAMILMSLKSAGSEGHIVEAEARPGGASAAASASRQIQDHRRARPQPMSSEVAKSCPFSICLVDNDFADDNDTQKRLSVQYQDGWLQIKMNEEGQRIKLRSEGGAMSARVHSNYEQEAILPDMPTRHTLHSVEYEEPISPSQVASALHAGPKEDNFTREEHSSFAEAYKQYPKRFNSISQIPKLEHCSREDMIQHYFATKRTTNYKKLVVQTSTLRPNEYSNMTAVVKEGNTGGGEIAGTLLLNRKRKRTTVEEQSPRPTRTRKSTAKSLLSAAEPEKPPKRCKKANDKPKSVSPISKDRSDQLPTKISGTPGGSLATPAILAKPDAPRKRGKQTPQPWPTLSSWKDNGENPPYSYTFLIAAAICDSQAKFLSISEIYRWISRHFSFFQNKDQNPAWHKSWTNSVRHFASSKKGFRKITRPIGHMRGEDDTGMGGVWTIACEISMGQDLLTKLNLSYDAPFALVPTQDDSQYHIMPEPKQGP